MKQVFCYGQENIKWLSNAVHHSVWINRHCITQSDWRAGAGEVREINISNRMFGRAIWDKLLECILENLEMTQVKREQYQNFQESRGWFIIRIARTKYVVTG